MKALLSVLLILFSISFSRGQSSTDDQGKIDQTLVGKWCYLPNAAESTESLTNSCITLNSDGSYEMSIDQSSMNSMGSSLAGFQSSDAGTWTVNGNRIMYVSNQRGKGSIRFQKANHPRLEKTPVILVEGVIFCSAVPRDPW